jgi:isoleucyl-tRNA synthetase
MPYSTACTTPLSNFEANQNYKDAIDPAGTVFNLFQVYDLLYLLVTVAFPLVNEPDVALLAWTTTPWTLPSNLSLAVNEEFDYIKIKGHSYLSLLT